MTTIIGIDPGRSGAMACIYQNGTGQVADLWYLGDLPDVSEIAAWIDGEDARIFMEKQQSMPKQGVASTFQTGMGYGALLAVCYLSEVPFHLVRANEWKKALGLIGKTKEDSRALAIQLFPALADQLKRVKDEGRAEALLIAYYGKKVVMA